VFNLGMGEITVILLLALIFLGPKKLPELASGLGRIIRDIRKATADVKNEIQLDEAIRRPFEELRDAVTLPPEELKRRDRIQKELDEARKRAEQEIKELANANADAIAGKAAEPGAGEAAPKPAEPGAGPATEGAVVAAAAAAPAVRTPTPPPTPPGAALPPTLLPPPGTVPAAPSRLARGIGAPLQGVRAPIAAGVPVPPPVRPAEKPGNTQFLTESDLLPPDAAAPPPPPPRSTSKVPVVPAEAELVPPAPDPAKKA
jgi:sec-independent protein translocase protein TatB